MPLAAANVRALLPEYPQAQFPFVVQAYSEADFNALRAGTTYGGNYEDFQAAVQNHGWFTDDYAGYVAFLTWWGAGIAPKRALGLWEFIGWQEAAYGIEPATALQDVNALVRAGTSPVDQAVIVLDAYNAERARRGLTVTTSSAINAAPEVKSTKRQILFAGGRSYFAHPMVPVIRLIGFRDVDIFNSTLPEGGNVRARAWQPLPAVWLVRQTGLFEALTASGQTFAPAIMPIETAAADLTTGGVSPAIAALAALPWPMPERAADLIAGEAAFLAWMAQQGGAWTPPITWSQTPIDVIPIEAAPFPVPFAAIPAGSTIKFATPGSGLPPTIKLAESTTFVPFSEVPPERWVDVTAPPSPEQLMGTLPVAVQADPSGRVRVNTEGQPVNPDGTPPRVLTPAMLEGGLSGLQVLLLAGLGVGAVIALAQGKRSRLRGARSTRRR
jgi:hypothetical protein